VRDLAFLMYPDYSLLALIIVAGVDRGLALIENHLGLEVAKAMGRKLISYRRCGGQSRFSALLELWPKSDRIQAALTCARDNLH
jgi:transcriptional regulator GlxA family with amidase domain